ncbi:ubiquinol-cytochrome C chaperone family protein [Terrihabitans sp. B22-R8]|uniref:ubiquinol-cytochrome C chaperone family protein n=1 Tax=Terrihabitans sp. B22-R8 TaxID=3425128 RepID=UPI00403C9349
MIFGLFRRSSEEDHAHGVYAAIVAQARQPVLYTDFGVPDTLEGRYEMLVLHLFLYLHRLKSEPTEIRARGQAVFDMMFKDMDRSLREMGVGDLTVPKKIKAMASAFYGRTAAYDEALAGGGGTLPEALVRNIGVTDAGGAAMADYVRACVDHLAAQTGAELSGSPPRFPDPASFTSSLEIPA